MKTPLSPKFIPIVHVTDFQTKVNPIEVGLSVLVDGRKAFIYEHMLNDGFYQREKIAIQFSEKHRNLRMACFKLSITKSKNLESFLGGMMVK